MQIFAERWVVFTRTGLPGDDHHLVIAYRLENLLFFLANRQVFRIGDGRTRRFAQRDFTGCCSLSPAPSPGGWPVAIQDF
ncbi:hypothetical protein LNQ03_00390 [Klebsiella pneumoniae subsp. pneumoniae]|nr:hypothetical protein [Klebsiella pneumoniae subsp. pneumoniae]